MLSLPTAVRVYLACGVTDMRKSIDGLSAVVQQQLREDPISGHLFVFCNRCRDRIKILYWDQSGYWLLHKRLEKGTFSWPPPPDDDPPHLEMTSSQTREDHGRETPWVERTRRRLTGQRRSW